jgi:hypothetical protein
LDGRAAQRCPNPSLCLHHPTTPAPLTGPRLVVLIRTWWRVEAREAAHRPKAVSFGRAWSDGKAQSTPMAVMPARAVVAVATRSRAATARLSAMRRRRAM